MPSGRKRGFYTVVAALAVALLVLPAGPWTGPASAEAGPVTAFAGGASNVTLGFRLAASNSTAGIDLPRGCTITSAEMDLEGVPRRQDIPRSFDFAAFNPTTTPHRAWAGWVLGNYPPTYPYWNPYGPHGSPLANGDYAALGASDDTRYRTATPASFPGEYPFHLFRLDLPAGDVTRLGVSWEGHGYCLANASTRGAEVFAWRNATQSWVRGEWYSKTEAMQDRVLEKEWADGASAFVDSAGRAYVLVYGKRSDDVAGPNPYTAEGELETDYLCLNVTFAGDWNYVNDPALLIAPHGQVWGQAGRLEGAVRLGAAEGLASALQAAVDAAAVEPSNVTIPLTVNVSQSSSAVVRLSNLSVVYTPHVNIAPKWGALPTLHMVEDVDSVGALDLDAVTTDDHSQGRLRFEVVWSSTDAIEARVEGRHEISLYTRQADWNGIAYITLNATDAWGANATSPPIMVEVTGVNDAPVIAASAILRGRQGARFDHHIAASDVDGDALAFSDDSPVFDIDPTAGNVSFVPTNADVGLWSFNVTATDGHGGTATAKFLILIENVNDPPAILDPGTLHGRQGQDFARTLEATDPDASSGDMLRWTLVGPGWALEDLLLNAITGELNWFGIGNDDVGKHEFVVQVTDGNGGVDELEVQIDIDNVNDPPSFPRIPDQAVSEDATWVYTIKALDPDLVVDPSEHLAWAVEPPWFNVTEGGTFSFTAQRWQAGERAIKVSVTDAAGAAYSQTFILTVIPINHPPVIGPVPDQALTEDVEWALTLVVSDPDSGDTWRLGGSAPFPIPQGGGVIMWTPREADIGDNPVRLEVTDPAGAIAVREFNLTVVGVDDPPTAYIRSPAEGTVVGRDEAVNLEAVVFDEEGAHLAVSWSWRPASGGEWTTITTGADGIWTDHPPGTLMLRVTASDGNHTATDDVEVQVRSPLKQTKSSAGRVLFAVMTVLLLGSVLGAVLLMRKRRPAEPATGPAGDGWEVVAEEPPGSR